MPVDRRCPEDVLPPSQLPTASGRADDLALIQRLVTNSEAAWCELVTRYAGQLRARIMRVTRSCTSTDRPTLVDDILAEVFRALLANHYAALRAYQGRSSLSTYMCAIATRVALRCSLQLGAGVQSNAALASLQDPRHASPEDTLLGQEQRQWLLQHIDRLPLKQRQLIRLFHLEGKSYREISELLSMPIGSIGPSIGRAEALLRQLLGEDFLS